MADASLTRIGRTIDVWAGVRDNPARRRWTVPAHGAVLLRVSERGK